MGIEGSDLVITSLCQCDPVVLQKDDFETVSDHGIVVDHLTDGRDQTDNHLGGVVSRSSLRERQGLRKLLLKETCYAFSFLSFSSVVYCACKRS